MWKGKSPYQTSDFLRQRHPYREKSFRSRLRDIRSQVFDGYGDDSFTRNIIALKDPDFPVEEKLKALVLIKRRMILPENIIKGIDFGVIPSLVHVLKEFEETSLIEYVGRVVQSVCSLTQGAEEFYKNGGYPLLVQVIRNTDRKYLKARCAACSAIKTIAQSVETCKLLWKNDDMSVITTLVWVLDKKESFANSELLLHALESLNDICRNPNGRALAASNKIVDHLKKVFEERRTLGLDLNMQNQLLDSPALKCTRAACLCVWNVCLDGEGKKLSKDIMMTISRVLIRAMEVKEVEMVRFIAGSILFICIYEDAKPVAIEKLFPNIDVTTSSVLCDLLELVSEEGRFPSLEDGLNTVENIEKNTVLALRSISKYPKARTLIRKILKEKGMKLYRKIFPKRNF